MMVKLSIAHPQGFFSSNDILQQLCRLKEMKPGKHPNNIDRK